MKPLDFIATARDLVEVGGGGRPRETNLRRAVSTTYYALFHCLAECCASAIAGRVADRGHPAWKQAYRALEHTFAANRCNELRKGGGYPDDIVDFAIQFAHMQKLRNSADYDPAPPGFNKSDVIQDIGVAEDVIRRFSDTPAVERRAFVVHVLLKRR